MNELTNWFDADAQRSTHYTEVDRLLVESLLRWAARRTPGGAVASEALVVAMLELARATRLDHAALSLSNVDLDEYVEVRTGCDAETLTAALIADDPVAAALVDVVDIARGTGSGRPIVVSQLNGTPRFAHLRRLALAEDHLARALLVAAHSPLSASIGPVEIDAVMAHADDEVLEVAQRLCERRISIVTGGPGTGKTTTIARLLRATCDAARASHANAPVRVALCAPTAKAATRLIDAIETALGDDGVALAAFADVIELHPRSGSVHRLLGLRPDMVAGDDLIDADLVVVDEVSMLELALLSQLVERCGERTRLLLVGDPDQLASVNVGAALRDIVDAGANDGPLGVLITKLERNFRSGQAIQELASAINAGDLPALRAVAREHADEVVLGAAPASVLHAGLERARLLAEAAVAPSDPLRALALLDGFVILCATREGRHSVAWWRERIGASLRTDARSRVAPGTPILVTRNESTRSSDEAGTLNNGDVGVAVTTDDGSLEVVFGPLSAPRRRRLGSLGGFESAWAMTIHKSQGSEYDEVVVSLPDHDVEILTRELLYTAVTRARLRVSVLASETTLQRVLARRISRVSGLVERVGALASLTATTSSEYD